MDDKTKMRRHEDLWADTASYRRATGKQGLIVIKASGCDTRALSYRFDDGTVVMSLSEAEAHMAKLLRDAGVES